MHNQGLGPFSEHQIVILRMYTQVHVRGPLTLISGEDAVAGEYKSVGVFPCTPLTSVVDPLCIYVGYIRVKHPPQYVTLNGNLDVDTYSSYYEGTGSIYPW